MFNPLNERVSLKELIASQIEDAILEKKYLPGSKLPSENELCNMFGVSRTSVREAVQVLQAHGLVSIEKGKGIFVKSISSENVSNSILKFLEHRFEGNYYFDLIHARQIIEPGIAYLASLNRTDVDLKKLEVDINNISKNDGDPVKHAEYDMSFHMHIAKASQNKLLPLLLSPIHRLMPAVKSKILTNVSEAKEAAVIWHTKIFEKIENQDPEGAQNAMIAHLKIAEKHIEQAVSASAGKN
jgi:GntR family transcriptional repressor for pyruvate dehydrogenase complex